MKSILSIILLLSFLMVNMSKSILLMNYEINKKEITQKYCINKDKPQMHCCGKCLLKRKLAEQEEQQKLPVFPDIKTDFQLPRSETLLALYNEENTGVDLTFIYQKLHSFFAGIGVYHPPSCC